MSLLDDFLSRYAREIDFYTEVARLCARQCETRLEQMGIRAIVTFRAKRPDRLREKVNARAAEKNYQRVEEIYDDVVDLAGVRIALYFPGDIIEVENVLNSQFVVRHTKVFPRDSGKPQYEKRFSGYAARHYHVHLASKELLQDQQRYASAHIEIQVASVLVHAWAEVEHDLVYKPLSGRLSED